MRLDKSVFECKQEWKAKGYSLPEFDVNEMLARTAAAPCWIHFGAGNIFRAFHANLVQEMLNSGATDRGIIVAEGYDYEIIEKMYRPHDNIGVLVTLKAAGSMDKCVVGSIAEALTADTANTHDWERLKEIFRSASLQMATFTITEKGYLLRSADGRALPGVEEDLTAGPACPKSYIGKVAALLHERYAEGGAAPVAMVSTDNCSHNGDKLYNAINAFAKAWEKSGVCKAGFAAYVNDAGKVSFPWTMIDKITPRPDSNVEKILLADGIEQLEPVITSKKTYVAPFVNAEECQYLVIEDRFPNGRPALEKVGVYFTDRATVDKVEKMKVCTCLNPLHTCLALFGCLLGYHLIADEMKDADLHRLVETLGYTEGLPVVVNPGILSPRGFIDEVVNIRIPNPFMPDTPQRIACDTSQKLSIRFGETIKAYTKREGLDVGSLKVIPLIFAGWLRYLMAVDDGGSRFELSPDPLLSDVCRYVEGIGLGTTDAGAVEKAVGPLLRRAEIFGVDLYETGLAGKVIACFMALIAGKGAVRQTIGLYK
ncbi:MAG: mannitol dehydrogenase family protein [Prevotellaceae bacterium]|nr:mannitol dehydrogenase family protein [Prevotellaceae bacterium]